MTERVVLAYSGGLDTSFLVPWVAEHYRRPVITVTVDTGGIDAAAARTLEERARALGAIAHYQVDARADYFEQVLRFLIMGNVRRGQLYPLCVGAERVMQAQTIAHMARKLGTQSIAHGCTAAGNDQVRFEVGITSLAPELKCISPVRDLALTRDRAIDYAEKHSLPIETTKSNPFSIDQNVWGRAVETGFLEDIWNAPTKDVYSYTDDPAFPPIPDEVHIVFEKGIPVAIDGMQVTPLQAIEELNRRAGAQGIGRIDVVEDRLVGIKSREVYEAPGAIALIAAHRELENCTIEREQARFKKQIEDRWTTLVYDGQWYSPLKASLDAFIEDTQRYVSGEIRMILHGGRATVTGRRSAASLYDFNLATYDEGDSYDQSNARGFIEIFGMTSKLAARRDVAFGNGVDFGTGSLG